MNSRLRTELTLSKVGGAGPAGPAMGGAIILPGQYMLQGPIFLAGPNLKILSQQNK